MQGVYRVSDTISGVTTAQTLIWIATAATQIIEIYSASITCQDEDTSEQIMAELNRITTIGSAAGTTRAAKPTEEASTAAGAVCKVDLTVEPTTYEGAWLSIASGGANKLGGWEYVPLPEERPIIGINDDVGLRLIDTITSSDLTASITFREIG